MRAAIKIRQASAALLIGAFGAVASGSAALSSSLDKLLYDQLGPFRELGVLNSQEARFLAKEAAALGVTRIRQMNDRERRWKRAPNQTGCGFSQKDGDISIDFTRAECVEVGNLIHEIAHLPAYGAHCMGHGDRFYRGNYQLAKKFENRFRRWGQSISLGVVVRSLEYRAGESSCKGHVRISG